jgi:hypothetical protein
VPPIARRAAPRARRRSRSGERAAVSGHPIQWLGPDGPLADDPSYRYPNLPIRAPAEREQLLLVGRDSELDVLEDALDVLFAGRGQLFWIAGEAGIGKSHLAREIVERVRRRRGTALVGPAYEQEGHLPYGPFVEALEPVGSLVAPPAGISSVRASRPSVRLLA